MTTKELLWAKERFSSVRRYRVGDVEYSQSRTRADYDSIVIGLTCFYGVLLDYNLMFANSDRTRTMQGYLRKMVTLVSSQRGEYQLDTLLASLDDLGDISLRILSEVSDFKDPVVDYLLTTWRCANELAPVKGWLVSLYRERDSDWGVEFSRLLRQVSCFLKKLDLDRPDLERKMYESYTAFEQQMPASFGRRMIADPEYTFYVSHMCEILDAHQDGLSFSDFYPKHGPGATADPHTKFWYDKHANACSDSRVAYLLRHSGLGTQNDYLPLVGEVDSTRTSRFICVPKSWKTLRGISAEPAELQFWQQGILDRIDRWFTTNRWWAARINLHCQDISRELALKGSLDGSLATVDLSSASDSVSLQLVKDLFGNSELGRWLVGTRSVFTQVGEQKIRICKFAPMGSACCFPVECIIFTLAAEVAVRQTPHIHGNRMIRVFGDDIILPSGAAPLLYRILQVLGFHVNESKSFTCGHFREACGVEAWCGQRVEPVRYRRSFSLLTTSVEARDISSAVAFSNELFARGLRGTRSFILHLLLRKKIRCGKKSYCVAQSVVASQDGRHSTMMSAYPENFQLMRKFSCTLQEQMFLKVQWRLVPKQRVTDGEYPQLGLLKYTDWLINHSGERSARMRVSEELGPFDRVPTDFTAVPTVKWVPTYFFEE